MTGERQPTSEGFGAELRGPDGRVKEARPVGGPPSGDGAVNVVEVVKALLLRKLTEEFRRKGFQQDIVRAANQPPGTETEIGIFLCLEPGQLTAVCSALRKARAARTELERAIRAYEMVKVQ